MVTHQGLTALFRFTHDMHNAPAVSVLVLTFNHVSYIRKALDSVLNQRLDCSWEVVIADDHSNDGTSVIVKEYGDKYPERIRVLESDRNLGVARNLQKLWSAARGEYVALIEGDDYWLSPNKLCLQVAILERDPTCVGVAHPVKIETNDRSEPTVVHPQAMPARISLQEILSGNTLPTCSVVLRRGIVDKLPEWLMKYSILDWPLWALHARRGDFLTVSEPMGVYRDHGAGVWSCGRNNPLKGAENHLQTARMLAELGRELGQEESIQLRRSRFNYLYQAASLFRDSGDFKRSFHCFRQACESVDKGQEFKIRCKMLVNILVPQLYKTLSALKSRKQ